MISLQKNFLFIHIFKTGGNSIQNILAPYAIDQIHAATEDQDGVERFRLKNDLYDVRKHSILAEYQLAIEPEVFQKLFKFTTIRNPWDRMISFYFSPHRGIDQWDREAFIELVHEVHTLDDFIRPLPQAENWKSRLGIKSKSPENQIDFFLRFEHINEDFKTLCEKIDIPYTPLPHRNKSTRSAYQDYYDEELISLVAEKHKTEIELGGYSF